MAAANRLDAKEKRQREQLAIEQETSAAREKAIREGIPGLGVPHWSAEAMDAMEILLSITTPEDIEAA